MSAYKKIEDHYRRIGEMHDIQAIVFWDEATMMPQGAGARRADALASLNVIVHGLETAPELAELLEQATAESLDEWQRANLALIRKDYLRATALSADFVESRTQIHAACNQAWRECRAANNWHDLLPLLQQNLRIVREEATLLGERLGLAPYDALLDGYEPGMTTERIESIFAELRAFLPGFIQQVQSVQTAQRILPFGDHFPIDQQRSLGLLMMKTLGFDFDHGRLDVSHHPFCGGVADDVRITTRYTEDRFAEAIMAVLHETGHALYEQGLPRDWRRTQPIGRAHGMGLHESQSLIMEMQACRSREFQTWFAPIAQKAFNRADSAAFSPENFYRNGICVRPGLIRVDADEVTYPLHIILRFEIETALINGQMEMADVPDAWDMKMQELLGISTKLDFKDGCLQDIHWMEGLFGYFPTYTIGALTAAQLFAAAKLQHPQLLQAIGEGDFRPLREWLGEHVHAKGSIRNTDELLLEVTGSALDVSYFKNHLISRYLG